MRNDSLLASEDYGTDTDAMSDLPFTTRFKGGPTDFPIGQTGGKGVVYGMTMQGT